MIFCRLIIDDLICTPVCSLNRKLTERADMLACGYHPREQQPQFIFISWKTLTQKPSLRQSHVPQRCLNSSLTIKPSLGRHNSSSTRFLTSPPCQQKSHCPTKNNSFGYTDRTSHH